MKLNNTTNERILSRHSSMVLKEYRGQGYLFRFIKRS